MGRYILRKNASLSIRAISLCVNHIVQSWLNLEIYQNDVPSKFEKVKKIGESIKKYPDQYQRQTRIMQFFSAKKNE